MQEILLPEDAKKLLEALGDKWNPIKCTPYKDNLDHMPRRQETNQAGNQPGRKPTMKLDMAQLYITQT